MNLHHVAHPNTKGAPPVHHVLTNASSSSSSSSSKQHSSSAKTPPDRFQWLFYATDPFTLGLFRIVFGLWLAVDIFEKFVLNTSQPSLALFENFTDFHFKYERFEWIPIPTGFWLRLHGWTMIISSFGLAFGWCYRSCSVLCLIMHTAFLLWDAAYYTDSLYLVCLLLFAFSVTDANNFGRLSGRIASMCARSTADRKKKQQMGLTKWYKTQAFLNSLCTEVTPHPAWHLCFFRFTSILPYIFGGLSKVNWDWLSGSVMSLWMTSSTPNAILRCIASIFFSWSIVLLQLFCGLGLIQRRRNIRYLSIALAVCVHLCYIFKYGQHSTPAPLLMLLSLVLFLDTDHLRSFVYSLGSRWESLFTYACLVLPPYYDQNFIAEIPVTSGSMMPVRWRMRSLSMFRRQFVLFAFGVWILIHGIVLPVRPYFYAVLSGQLVKWTENGRYFSWHDGVAVKECHGYYVVINTATNAQFTVQSDEAAITDPVQLSPMQMKRRFESPLFIRQYANFLSDWYAAHWNDQAEINIFANVTCSVNGSPFRPIINSSINLSKMRSLPTAFSSLEQMFQEQTRLSNQ